MVSQTYVVVTILFLSILKVLTVYSFDCPNMGNRYLNQTAKIKCYRLFSGSENTGKPARICEIHNGKLAKIITAEDMYQAKLVILSRKYYGISKVRVDGYSELGNWVTMKNRQYNMREKSSSFNCGALFLKYSSLYIRPEDCLTKYRYICQMPRIYSSSCRKVLNITKSYGDKCYSLSYNRYNFYEASTHCQLLGGELADERIHRTVYTKFRNALQYRNIPVWLGLTNKPWRFSNGDMIKSFYWQEHEPVSDRLTLLLNGATLKWATIEESQPQRPYPFLCEKEYHDDTRTTTRHVPTDPSNNKGHNVLNISIISL
ncbi:DgyrCDS1483 [Dimorphilus gyrociliatus]|uniref:DgyrCDS1483 n=1 Tax=Dimorphilus gyrociliatus TaxID=2664684 RepID=A0A7I8VCJ1_9ANNE|nr:DgyrCDS1483 [Dimorphilus gyrociliatus]